MLSISIVMPVFNSETLLKRFLSKNLSYCNAMGIDDVIIVDDASDDGTVSYIHTHFSQVRLIKNKVNKGFSISANRGISVAKSDFVFLLHSDVLIETLAWEDMLRCFDHPTVFAVAPPIYDHVTHGLTSYTQGAFIGTTIVTRLQLDLKNMDSSKPGEEILWAESAAVLMRRDQFSILGGFDSMFDPFYGEGLDLSYRAWKQGLTTLLCPKGAVVHYSEYGIESSYTEAYSDRVTLRNKYLFMWKNISAKRYLCVHIAAVIVTMLTFRIRECRAILDACFYIPRIVMYRLKKSVDILSDQEVLTQWNINR